MIKLVVFCCFKWGLLYNNKLTLKDKAVGFWIFFFRRGGATGPSCLAASLTFGLEFADFVLAITSGSCRGSPQHKLLSAATVDNVNVLGYCDVSFELGVDPESCELFDNADTEDVLSTSCAPAAKNIYITH